MQPPFDKFVVILFYRISLLMSSFFLKKIMALARNEFHYQHQKLYNLFKVEKTAVTKSDFFKSFDIVIDSF